MVDRGALADAAAELDMQIDGLADRGHRGAIDRMAGEGAVQVDDVQPFKAGIGKIPGLRRRIVVEHDRARHFAADQAHAFAVFEVDRRIEDHGASGPTSSSL